MSEGKSEQQDMLEKFLTTKHDNHEEESTEEEQTQNQEVVKIEYSLLEEQDSVRNHEVDLNQPQEQEEHAITKPLDQVSQPPFEEDISSHQSVTEEKSDKQNSHEQRIDVCDELTYQHEEIPEEQQIQSQDLTKTIDIRRDQEVKLALLQRKEKNTQIQQDLDRNIKHINQVSQPLLSTEKETSSQESIPERALKPYQVSDNQLEEKQTFRVKNKDQQLFKQCQENQSRRDSIESHFFKFNDMESPEGQLFTKLMNSSLSRVNRSKSIAIEVVLREKDFNDKFNVNEDDVNNDLMRSQKTFNLLDEATKNINEALTVISARREIHIDNVHLWKNWETNKLVKREYNIIRLFFLVNTEKSSIGNAITSLENIGIKGVLSPIHNNVRSELIRAFDCQKNFTVENEKYRERLEYILNSPFIDIRVLIGTTKGSTGIFTIDDTDLPTLYRFSKSLEFSAYHNESIQPKINISPNMSVKSFVNNHLLNTVFETVSSTKFKEVTDSLLEIRTTERFLSLINLMRQSEKEKIKEITKQCGFLEVLNIKPNSVIFDGRIDRRRMREEIKTKFSELFRDIEGRHDRGALQFGKAEKNTLSKTNLELSVNVVSRIASLAVDYLMDLNDPRFLAITQEIYNIGRNLWLSPSRPLNRYPESAHTDILMKTVTLTSMFLCSFNNINTKIDIDERWKSRELSGAPRISKDVFPESAGLCFNDPIDALWKINQLKINVFEYAAAPKDVNHGSKLFRKWYSNERMTNDLRLRAAYIPTIYSLFRILGFSEIKSVTITSKWFKEGSSITWGNTDQYKTVMSGKSNKKYFVSHSRTPREISLFSHVYGLYLGGEHGQGVDGMVISPYLESHREYDYRATLWEIKRPSVRIENQKANRRIKGSFSPSSKLLISNARKKTDWPQMNHGQSFFGMFLFFHFNPNITSFNKSFIQDDPSEFSPVKGVRQGGSIYYSIPPGESSIFLFRMRELQELRCLFVEGSINIKELNLIGLKKTHPKKRNNMEFDLQIKKTNETTEVFTTEGLRRLLIGTKCRGKWDDDLLNRSIFKTSIPEVLSQENRLLFWENKITEIEDKNINKSAKYIEVIRLMKEFSDSVDFKNMLRDIFPSTNRSALGLMKGKALMYENWRLIDICRVLNVLWRSD